MTLIVPLTTRTLRAMAGRLCGDVGLALLAALWPLASAHAAPIPVVAAESTYGAIAQAIGGPYVQVSSIIQNPNVDPHQFEATPQTARSVAHAAIVVMNGLGYDDWMRKMLAANPAPKRVVIVAAALDPALVMPDQNPHVFYDPRVGALVAQRLAALLQQADPAHAADFKRNLQAFEQSLRQVDGVVRQLAAQHPGLAVLATEPVYGYMLRQLGWRSLGDTFQFNVMNGTEPAPHVVARYEDELRQHRAALLVYNSQVSDPLTQRMRDIARQSGIPTVGVSEFAPPGMGYTAWLLSSLHAVQQTLAKAGR
ncbi:putative ABC-type metal ion transport system, periplasmic component [Thiomonas sp. X19]|uniref:metal ABC transporter solute-binding protein, Zn/Mn family n=1 Tax=Thiomonas sp. X19 TaxID=1050370 RepID=UPI000B690AAD|nr:zinc ABC transporter substrate-binding protein [Thiomonas sp. X19]SCC91618.1 putative ABC-type metal ion transport system, periplasmic component [Thiomonas sp. X19]